MDEGECPGGCGWVPRLCKCPGKVPEAPEPRDKGVEEVRKLLKHWDEGLISSGEFEGRITDSVLQPIFDLMAEGKELKMFGSCCCSGHPPDRAFHIELTLEPHGFTARPLFRVGTDHSPDGLTPSLESREAAVRLSYLAEALSRKGVQVRTGATWDSSGDALSGVRADFWYLYLVGRSTEAYRIYDVDPKTLTHTYDAGSVRLEGALDRVAALPSDPDVESVWKALSGPSE
jgi:hypothetical protein